MFSFFFQAITWARFCKPTRSLWLLSWQIKLQRFCTTFANWLSGFGSYWRPKNAKLHTKRNFKVVGCNLLVVKWQKAAKAMKKRQNPAVTAVKKCSRLFENLTNIRHDKTWGREGGGLTGLAYALPLIRNAHFKCRLSPHKVSINWKNMFNIKWFKMIDQFSMDCNWFHQFWNYSIASSFLEFRKWWLGCNNCM